MAGISGMGTTFNLPNYVGELFAESREDAPFLSAIGGLTGGREASGTIFQWTAYDLRTSTANNVAAEGANAPTATGRVRRNITNVVEVHHSAIDVSYTKLAATGQFQDVASNHPMVAGLAGSNAVMDEQDWQIRQELKAMALDINQSFLNGTYQEPSDNNTNRQTRGLRAAITTNIVNAQGYALDDVTAPGNIDFITQLQKMIYDNGGLREGATRVLICNSTQKVKITHRYITGPGLQPRDRTIGGANVTEIVTDFGPLNVLMDPAMPQDEIVIASIEECAPRFLRVPGKGFLFVEPLAKIGASERAQIYGEVGLEYGLEKHHGKITNLATVAAS